MLSYAFPPRTEWERGKGIVHKREDLLIPSEIERFSKPVKGFNPETWGDVIDYRINRQKKSFSTNNPLGSLENPRLTGKIKPSTVEGFSSVHFNFLEENRDIIKRLSEGIQETPNRGVIGNFDASRLISDPIYIDVDKKTLQIVGITNGRHRLLYILDNLNSKNKFFDIKIYFIE